MHPNASLVVGGIEEPRFLIVGDELSPNVSFEDDITGFSGSATFSQYSDTSTPHGDYSLKVEDDSAAVQQYIEIAIDTGAPIADKRFIVYGFVRNDSDEGQRALWCVYQGLSGTHEKTYMADLNWRRLIVHEVVVPSDATGNTLTYRIYPTAASEGVAGVGAIRIDDFHCRQVLDEFILPVPDSGNCNETFIEIKQAEHQLANRSRKKYTMGFEYIYEAGYQRLTAAEEISRTQIARENRDIMFFPHKDSPNCYLCFWDDEFDRSWAFGTGALGHEGQVFLRSQEVLHIVADDIVDAGTIYEYEDDAFYGEGGVLYE